MSRNRLDKDGLNAKQARFVDEYLKDLNAKQAAIRAGYSPHTAEVQGSRLLSHAKVGRIIGRRIEERKQRVTVKADEVVERLRIHAFGRMAHYFEKTGRLLEPHEMTPEALGCRQSECCVNAHMFVLVTATRRRGRASKPSS